MESPTISGQPSPPPNSATRKPRQSILAWWGVIPALFSLIIQIKFGAVEAKNSTGKDFPLSSVLGGYVAVLMMAMLVAWIAYHTLRRSQLAGTLAFWAVLSLFSFGVISGSRIPVAPTARAPISSTVLTPSSYGDFSCDTPAGWLRAAPDRKNTVAIFVPPGTTAENVRSMIKIDVGKTRTDSAREVAASFAGGDGKSPTPISLDGKDAFQVEISGDGGLAKPRFVVASVRDQKLYLIMAAGPSGIDLAGALQQIIKTWRWEGAP